MKKSISYLVLFISIGLFIVINFGYSFAFLIGENGETLTSTIVGDVIIDGSFNLANYSFFTDSDDVNAIRVIGGETTLINPSIDKNGNTDREDAFILGNNCAVWVRENSTLRINNGYINSDGLYAGGACSYNGNLFLDSVKITTIGSMSSAVMSSHGGLVSGNNLEVVTNGNNSPAITNIDGEITISGGSYSTFGNNSSYIYAYDDVSVSNAVLSSGSSSGVSIYKSANIILDSNTITNGDIFLLVENNYDEELNAYVKLINQSIKGNIVVDKDSKLNMDILNKSNYEGIINDGNITVNISSDSKIVLKGDSYIKAINDDDKEYSNINFNGFCLYVNGLCINKKKETVNKDDSSNNKVNNNSNNVVSSDNNKVNRDNNVTSNKNNDVVTSGIDNKIDIEKSYDKLDNGDIDYDSDKVIDDGSDLVLKGNSYIGAKDLVLVNVILILSICISLGSIIRNKLKIVKNS